MYNDCHNSDSINRLRAHLHPLRQGSSAAGPSFNMWCGNFNWHHPMWDEERNHHLFTAWAIEESEQLITLAADCDMYMVLPKDMPTLVSMSTKNWTQPDNVFCSTGLADSVVCCMTDPGLRGPGTDNVLILMALEFPVEQVISMLGYNFREVNWEAFQVELRRRLADVPGPASLGTETDLMAAIDGITEALQDTIHAVVPRWHPSPHSKRWWSRKLTKLKKWKNKLSNIAYKFRVLPDHPIHEQHRSIKSEYSAAITETKREHWIMFLEGLSYSEVWTANWYISGENTDSGKTRIPTLMQQLTDPNLLPMVASTNEEKSLMLAKLMFPPRSAGCGGLLEEFDDQLPDPPAITEAQIRRHIACLHPHKVPGTDEIPNIILKKSVEMISLYLLQIFRAVLRLQVYPAQWKDIITCVLRKPGKPRYDVPKVYHPIMLVNTISDFSCSNHHHWCM